MVKRVSELGRRILHRMIDVGIKHQKELAERVGLSPASINNFITGEATPRAATFIRLSEALDCSVDYLLGRADVPKPEEAVSRDVRRFLLGDEDIRSLLRHRFSDEELSELEVMFRLFNSPGLTRDDLEMIVRIVEGIVEARKGK